jgi:hypothetical protein
MVAQVDEALTTALSLNEIGLLRPYSVRRKLQIQ